MISPMRELDTGGMARPDRMNRCGGGNKSRRFRIENGDRIDPADLADAPRLPASGAQRAVQPAPQHLLPRLDPPVIGIRESDRFPQQKRSVEAGHRPARRLQIVGDFQHGKPDTLRSGLAQHRDDAEQRHQQGEGRSRSWAQHPRLPAMSRPPAAPNHPAQVSVMQPTHVWCNLAIPAAASGKVLRAHSKAPDRRALHPKRGGAALVVLSAPAAEAPAARRKAVACHRRQGEASHPQKISDLLKPASSVG